VSINGLVVLLAEPRVRDLHIKLGYDVDALVSEAPYLEEKQLAAKLMHKQILSIDPARDWLHVEDRWRCWWDDSVSATGGQRSILTAPSMDELFERCHLDTSPPTLRIPSLPAQLPQRDSKHIKRDLGKAQHKWPFEPTSARLGLASSHARACTG